VYSGGGIPQNNLQISLVYKVNQFTFGSQNGFMRALFLLFCLLLTSVAFTQVLHGTVVDTKGQPVAGASVSLKDSYDGATTDSVGRFSFRTSEKGGLLQVTAIGYKPAEQAVVTGAAAGIRFTLKEEVTELKAVVITAGSFEASDKKKATVLSSIDIVTTASANADVTAAVKTLPGAQQVGESEGLFVRGGTAQETKTFIDGTLVNNFFFSSVPNVAQRGRFSPFIFKGTVFSSGGYSALYGQALSAALILESIDLPEQSSANLGVSVIGLSGGYQHLAKNKRSSWGLNYSYTNVGPGFALLRLRDEIFRVPVTHNADGNFRIKTKGGMLKYCGYLSTNTLGIRQRSLDTAGFKDMFALTNYNTYHNLSWREQLGRGWKMQLGASYSTNRDRINAEFQDADNQKQLLPRLETRNFGLQTFGHYVNGKAVFEYRLKGLSALRFGSEYNFSDDRSDYQLYTGQVFPNRVREHLKSLFAEGDVYLTNALAARVGMRAEHSALIGRTNLAPRLSLSYKVGKEAQASLAYGVFYQTPENRFLPAAASLDFARATHYIAQYQKVTARRTFRAELFYKRYESLIKTGVVNGRESAVSSNGYGHAKGVEFFWRDKQTVKNLDYWISYSYLDTRRNFLNFPTAIEPNFAARHTASLVMKRFVPSLKTMFNASYSYATGRPYYFIGYNSSTDKFQINDAGRTIDYHSASVSINYLPHLGKKGAKANTVYVLSVSNVIGNLQQFGYRYSSDGRRKEALTPPTNRFIFIGVFFSFGVDRSEEVINANL